jgi:hypothetical protein
MNFVHFSPHFPPNYRHFSMELRRLGATVLGVGDAAYEQLHPQLAGSLHEYYRVANMQSYDELVRAIGFFTHRFGKIDRIESFNEYWLESDARLRTDFNIRGYKIDDLAAVKRKSLMKDSFLSIGLTPARGRVLRTREEALKFVDEVGFPLIAKPDIGVGAYKTYKVQSMTDLDFVFTDKLPVDYIFEEFIYGYLQSFDGLTDQDGRVVFCSSFNMFPGVMEAVNNDLDLYYYTQREIPADVEDAGQKIVRQFDLRERFFHFEFFRTPEEKLVPIEVNMRPPGGLTTDMFNYANDIDIYHEYASVVLFNHFEAEVDRPYYCCYIGRKNNKNYTHSHDEIIDGFSDLLVQYEPISGVFSAALGDYGYLVRSSALSEIEDVVDFIQEKY